MQPTSEPGQMTTLEMEEIPSVPSLPNRIWKRIYPWLVILVGGAAVIALTLLGKWLFEDRLPDYELNLFTEFVSIFATVAVLNTLAKRREEQQRLQEYIYEAGSPVQGIAVSAVRKLYRSGYLNGTSSVLRGEDLHNADLSKAELESANLDEVDFNHAQLREMRLQKASLRHANLAYADLQGSDLSGAHLEETELFQADLRGARLTYAHLESARLVEANLCGANLRRAKLHGAKLDGIICDTHTVLPNGKYWKPGMTLDQFTQ